MLPYLYIHTLFHSAAIYESGTMLISREDFKASKTYRAAQGIAGHFNCSSTNYDYNMLDCLQQVSVEDLVSSASVDAPTGLAEEDDSTAWFPFVDMHSRDPVLPIDSLTAMKNGYFNHVPIMTGKLVLILRAYFIRVLNLLIKTLEASLLKQIIPTDLNAIRLIALFKHDKNISKFNFLCLII